MRGKTKDRTYKQDTKNVEKHLLPFFGNDVIRDLGEVRIEEYVSNAKNEKVGIPTINYSLRMLRKLMHGMRKRKLLTDVPSMPFEKENVLRNEFSE
jgi:Phage integrase, N-terminal SAM-like domain